MQSGDFIGWTITSEVGIISVTYTDNEFVLFYDITGQQTQPVLNGNYVFGELPLPAIFSIAAQVNPSENLFPLLAKIIRDSVRSFCRRLPHVRVMNLIMSSG